jgi:hypothetical protein
MMASRHRKLAVSTIRDAGANTEDQSLLARHMAPTVETADRYYDRSRQTQGRHAVLDRILVVNSENLKNLLIFKFRVVALLNVHLFFIFIFKKL